MQIVVTLKGTLEVNIRVLIHLETGHLMILESSNSSEAERMNSCIKMKCGGKLIGIFTIFLLVELFCPKNLQRIIT